MNRLTATAITLAAAAVLWLAGEQHRENCIHDGRTSCSVLPWDQGNRTSNGGLSERERELLLREAREAR